MKMKQSNLIIISLIFILLSFSNSKFLLTPRENILSQEIFGISAHCSNHFLGNNIAEFQMMKSNHTFVSFNIQKNFELLGITDDEKSNPDRVKTFNVVVDHKKKLRATFWIDIDDKIHLEKQKEIIGINNYLVPCLMWTENFLSISEFYNKSEEVELNEDEIEMGDVKYSYKNQDTKDKIIFNYFLKESNLTFMYQIYPNMKLNSYLIMEIKDSKIMKESDLDKIPFGLLWEYLD
jgi:hypothetical protein